MRTQTAAYDLPRQRAAAREGRGVHAPHPQHFLSVDGGCFRAHAPGHDRAVLYGRMADGLHRSAVDYGRILVYFGVLCGGSARALSQTLEALDSAASGP